MKLLPDGMPPFVLVAGVVGAVLAAVMDMKTPARAFRKLVAGCASSMYVTPVTVKGLLWLKLSDDHAMGLAGFLTGFLGLLIAELIYQAAKDNGPLWLRRRIGGTDAPNR